MIRVPLSPGLEGRREAWIRPLTGAEEAAPLAPLALLARALVPAGPWAVGPEQAQRLPMVDRDRLLLALHQQCFGDVVRADATCTACTKRYTVSFALSELAGLLDPPLPAGVEGPDAEGAFTTAGTRFRLPAPADIAAAGSAGPRALLDACVLDGDASAGAEAVESAMDQLNPVLDLAIDTACAECGAPQAPRFEIGAFLTHSLAGDRPFLIREIHCIARSYGWSHTEIMALPREDRRAFVRLICDTPERALGPASRARAVG